MWIDTWLPYPIAVAAAAGRERSRIGRSPPNSSRLFRSENLGGLFLGTLNFSAAKARCLIRLGYEDMSRVPRPERRAL